MSYTGRLLVYNSFWEHTVEKNGRLFALSDKKLDSFYGEGYGKMVQEIFVKKCTASMMTFEYMGGVEHCKIARLKKALRQK